MSLALVDARGDSNLRIVRSERGWSASGAWLVVPILAVHVVLSLTRGVVPTAFEDEGLYLSEGHLLLGRLFDSDVIIPDAPGAYFSGAPVVYPVLAALVDGAGGLPVARGLSLFFTSIAVVAVWSAARTLLGRAAAVVAAAVFASAGPLMLQANLATFDAMMTALIASALALGVRSAVRGSFRWAPIVGVLLAVAVLTKYAALVYIPVVMAVCCAAGWHRSGRVVVQRAVAGTAVAVSLLYLVFTLWGQSWVAGFRSTTSSRVVLNPTPTSELLATVWSGAGWILLIACLGVVSTCLRQLFASRGARDVGRLVLVLVLLGGACVAPLQQVRIGESTSLSKHLTFGLVFAAPLFGAFFSEVLRLSKFPRHRVTARACHVLVSAVAVLAVASCAVAGSRVGKDLVQTWIPDDQLTEVLRERIEENPGQTVLGEQPAPERYGLRDVLPAHLLSDTYYFPYGGTSGEAAYELAISRGYFDLIWLSGATANGVMISDILQQPANQQNYHVIGRVPRVLDGTTVGEWVIYQHIEGVQ